MLKYKSFYLMLHVCALATARGTQGGSVNQWNQNPNQQQFPQTKGAPLGGWDDEVNNPQGGLPGASPMWKIEDAIPGVPGQSYPNHDKVPQTSFDCRRQMFPGYYADSEAQCQVFHICQSDGRQNSFLCPLGTIFNQETFVCDWWFNVNCADSDQYTARNGNLYKSPYLGIDGLKTPGYAQRQGQGAGQRQSPGRRQGPGRDQGFGGAGGQGGNFQPSAVGIPNFDSQNRRGSWPSQGQGRPRAGTMKGDGRGRNQSPDLRNRGPASMGNRRVNQKGSTAGGPNFTNRNPANMAGDPGRVNPGMNQKGSRSPNTNGVWNQQGAHPRGNEKGRGNPTIPGNGGWRQRAQMGMGNMNSRGFGSMKGEMWNPRRSLMQGGSRGGPDDGRMGPNQSKGFDSNRWSLGPQNFQAQEQTTSGRGNDALSNNFGAGVSSPEANFPLSPKGQQGPDHQQLGGDLGPVSSQGGNWAADDGPQWNRNAFEGNGGGNQGYAKSQSWNSENGFNREASWQTNDQYRNNHEVDYDYS